MLRKSEEYCLNKYGRIFKVNETNQDCPDFINLPIESQLDIINHVWHIDFEEEDNIALKEGSIRDKLKVIVYRLCGRKIGKAYTDFFVDDMIFITKVCLFILLLWLLIVYLWE